MLEETACQILYRDTPNPFSVRLQLEVGRMVSNSYRGPGQFVHLKCGENHFLRRPISVSSAQTGLHADLISLVFEVRGSGTAWLAKQRVGDSLNVLGLLGNGFSMRREGSYLLVGGGIGVPPLLACAQLTAGHSDAVLGFRDAAHALLYREFQHNCRTTYTTTEDGSLGETGFVTGPMETLLRENSYDAVLCCGPKPMLKAASRLAKQYQTPCQVSCEERMACGVGACLGCAILMADGSIKQVCKDGPVFNAEEVDWNG